MEKERPKGGRGKSFENRKMQPSNKIIFSVLTLFGIIFSLSCAVPREEPKTDLEEQSFFSGTYEQTNTYGDGQSVDLGNQSTGGIVYFDLQSRDHQSFSSGISSSDIQANDFYSPAFEDYSFKKYSDNKYDSLIVGTDENPTMNGVAWGPKESPSNSTCKIRAYYHDVSFDGGLITIMYDFTGFLVGDSLLMTAAHGLYRDVTVGDFDDGIDNKYIPGKIEVYGAIGMADTWGSSYCYYAKGTEIFLPSSYITYRSFADDWALMRLDRPLGRELSYRKLSTDSMHLSSDYRIIGCPSLNQFHLRLDVSSADYVVDCTRPMIEYSVSSVDGMSGSPFYSAEDESFNVLQGSDGKSYLATRAAYGMHVCSNTSHTTSYAITFNSQILGLVDLLNSKYERGSDEIEFGELSGQTLSEAIVPIGGGYSCSVSAEGCSISGGKLALSPGSSVSFEFPFPLSWTAISAEGLPSLPNLNASCRSYDERCDLETTIEPSDGGYSIYLDGLRSITISRNASGNSGTVYLNSISFAINWTFMPSNYYAPQCSNIEGSNGNCVSYAVEGLRNENLSPILPKRENGSVLNRLTDLYPGMVVAGLARALAAEQIEMTPIGKYEFCSPGSYKIAIICDPYRYYHVIRQGYSYSSWSHYIINEGVQCQDWDNEPISQPDKARILHPVSNVSGSETHFDASTFVGYFSIRSVEND